MLESKPWLCSSTISFSTALSPSTSQRSLLLSPPGKEKSSAVTSNIIVDAEQVDTPDQAEQARNMLTVVSEQDQQETPKAEEAIDNSEMQEPVDLAEN